jgi:hypothetical protein
MPCPHANIPKYLQYSIGQKIFKQKRFKNRHLLYRTGIKENFNPIEFPFSSTAISVCWSFLIAKKDVLDAVLTGAKNPEKLGNNVYFSYVKDIRTTKVEMLREDGVYKGNHILTTVIKHSPFECNYSHSEILINHVYYENDELKSKVLEHDDWNKSLFKKWKKGAEKEFFKRLNLEYTATIATYLSRDCSEIDIPFYYKIISKKFILRVLFFWRVIVSRLG